MLQSLQENAFTVKEQPTQKNMQKEKKYLYSNSHHSGRNKIMFKLADLELVWKQEKKPNKTTTKQTTHCLNQQKYLHPTCFETHLGICTFYLLSLSLVDSATARTVPRPLMTAKLATFKCLCCYPFVSCKLPSIIWPNTEIK